MSTITLRHTDYGPTDHAGGNSLANSSGHALDTIKSALDDATVGDTIEYDQMDLIDDLEADTLRKLLKDESQALYDTGGERKIGWLYAVDGNLLDENQDDVFGKQPETSTE